MDVYDFLFMEGEELEGSVDKVEEDNAALAIYVDYYKKLNYVHLENDYVKVIDCVKNAIVNCDINLISDSLLAYFDDDREYFDALSGAKITVYEEFKVYFENLILTNFDEDLLRSVVDNNVFLYGAFSDIIYHGIGGTNKDLALKILSILSYDNFEKLLLHSDGRLLTILLESSELDDKIVDNLLRYVFDDESRLSYVLDSHSEFIRKSLRFENVKYLTQINNLDLLMDVLHLLSDDRNGYNMFNEFMRRKYGSSFNYVRNSILLNSTHMVKIYLAQNYLNSIPVEVLLFGSKYLDVHAKSLMLEYVNNMRREELDKKQIDINIFFGPESLSHDDDFYEVNNDFSLVFSDFDEINDDKEGRKNKKNTTGLVFPKLDVVDLKNDIVSRSTDVSVLSEDEKATNIVHSRVDSGDVADSMGNKDCLVGDLNVVRMLNVVTNDEPDVSFIKKFNSYLPRLGFIGFVNFRIPYLELRDFEAVDILAYIQYDNFVSYMFSLIQNGIVFNGTKFIIQNKNLYFGLNLFYSRRHKDNKVQVFSKSDLLPGYLLAQFSNGVELKMFEERFKAIRLMKSNDIFSIDLGKFIVSYVVEKALNDNFKSSDFSITKDELLKFLTYVNEDAPYYLSLSYLDSNYDALMNNLNYIVSAVKLMFDARRSKIKSPLSSSDLVNLIAKYQLYKQFSHESLSMTRITNHFPKYAKYLSYCNFDDIYLNYLNYIYFNVDVEVSEPTPEIYDKYMYYKEVKTSWLARYFGFGADLVKNKNKIDTSVPRETLEKARDLTLKMKKYVDKKANLLKNRFL